MRSRLPGPPFWRGKAELPPAPGRSRCWAQGSRGFPASGLLRVRVVCAPQASAVPPRSFLGTLFSSVIFGKQRWKRWLQIISWLVQRGEGAEYLPKVFWLECKSYVKFTATQVAEKSQLERVRMEIWLVTSAVKTNNRQNTSPGRGVHRPLAEVFKSGWL